MSGNDNATGLSPFDPEDLDYGPEPELVEVTLRFPDLGFQDDLEGSEQLAFHSIIDQLREFGLKFQHLALDGTYSMTGTNLSPEQFQAVGAFLRKLKDDTVLSQIISTLQVLPQGDTPPDGVPLLIQIDGAPLTQAQVREVLGFVEDFDLDAVSVCGSLDGRAATLDALGDTDLRESMETLLGESFSFSGITLHAPDGFSPLGHDYLKTLSGWLRIQGVGVSTSFYSVRAPAESETDFE
ncbi:MAG: hypothetical protein WC777_00530 [Candidatus Gracilibacteria bacterium]|jgi:hypothetical protein